MSRPARRLLHAAPVMVAIGVGLIVAGRVDAQPVTAPFVELDRYQFRAGAQVKVTVGGFSSRTVTVSVCGNEARRGSSDCNMPESEGIGIDSAGEVEMAEMSIAAPPVPCPCIIRAASPNNDEVAVADISLIGHPVGPLSGGDQFQQPIAVTVHAEPSGAGFGWLRSSLGGATEYAVAITVKNTATYAVENLSITGTAGSGGGDVDVNLEIPQPGTLAPGATWEETVDARLPAPVYGDAEWKIIVAGAGPTVTAVDGTSHLPGLLMALIVVLVADLFVIAARRLRRRAAKVHLRAGRQKADHAAVTAEPTLAFTDSARPMEPSR